MTRTLRYAAYGFAVLGIVITMPLAAAAGDQGIVVAVLGGTLAVTPYVMVRALEEFMRESVHRLGTEVQVSTPRTQTRAQSR